MLTNGRSSLTLAPAQRRNFPLMPVLMEDEDEDEKEWVVGCDLVGLDAVLTEDGFVHFGRYAGRVDKFKIVSSLFFLGYDPHGLSMLAATTCGMDRAVDDFVYDTDHGGFMKDLALAVVGQRLLRPDHEFPASLAACIDAVRVWHGDAPIRQMQTFSTLHTAYVGGVVAAEVALPADPAPEPRYSAAFLGQPWPGAAKQLAACFPPHVLHFLARLSDTGWSGAAKTALNRCVDSILEHLDVGPCVLVHTLFGWFSVTAAPGPDVGRVVRADPAAARERVVERLMRATGCDAEFARFCCTGTRVRWDGAALWLEVYGVRF